MYGGGGLRAAKGTGVAADGETRGTRTAKSTGIAEDGEARGTGETRGTGGSPFASLASFDHSAWLWVDQDSDETHTARVPVRVDGRLEVREWKLKPAPAGDVAAASAPAFSPAPFSGGEPALVSVGEGIRAAINALRKHADEPSAGRQMAAALTDLLSRYLRRGAGRAVFATDLMRTSLGDLLVAKMRDDPRGCAECYNRAVLATPEAKVATLATGVGVGGAGGDGDGGAELPMWWIAPSTARRRVFARELQGEPAERGALVPRALLMTGMVRMSACDLFIHGTGGGVYDAITEAWLGEWLGVSLAPTLVVTADLRLPLARREVSERDVSLAKWRAHRARHDPMMLGDAAAAQRKAGLVEAVRAARARGEDALPHYRAMHEMLAGLRGVHAEELRALEREAAETEAAFAEREVAMDRTWPFVFHEAGAIDGMDLRINSRGA